MNTIDQLTHSIRRTNHEATVAIEDSAIRVNPKYRAVFSPEVIQHVSPQALKKMYRSIIRIRLEERRQGDEERRQRDEEHSGDYSNQSPYTHIYQTSLGLPYFHTIRRCLSQNTQIQLPMIDSYWFYKLPTLPLPGSFATVRDPAMARLPPGLRDRPNDPSSRRLPSAFEQVRATPLQHQRSIGGAQPQPAPPPQMDGQEITEEARRLLANYRPGETSFSDLIQERISGLTPASF
ncbi:hypothetical protein P152DRAFT_455726, partial [Eremomyces bilateralis CBS 781.70]